MGEEQNQGKESKKESDVEKEKDVASDANRIAEALGTDDPEEKKKLTAIVSKFSKSPVPPPEILKGYDQVIDGGAKWLMEYTKDEQQHRHRMDRKELNYYMAGQVFGFVLGGIGTIGGIYLASIGAELSGFAIFFASLASLVGLFVYNKRTQKSDEGN